MTVTDWDSNGEGNVGVSQIWRSDAGFESEFIRETRVVFEPLVS